MLQKFRSPELQILDLTISNTDEAFALPPNCLTDAGYMLRALILDFIDAPTNMESVWEAVAIHCQTLETLRLNFYFMSMSDTCEAAKLALFANVLRMRTLRSLDLRFPFPNLADFEITPEANLERLHLEDLFLEPSRPVWQPLAFLCYLLPMYTNLKHLMLGMIFDSVVVDIITKSCTCLIALYVSVDTTKRIQGRMLSLLKKLAEKSDSDNAVVKWLPILETLELGQQVHLSSLEQVLLEKVKRARPNLEVDFSKARVEYIFDEADFVYLEIADLVWKRYDY